MRSSAALLVGVLLVVSAVAVAGVGAAHSGQNPARSPSAASTPAAGLPGSSAVLSDASVALPGSTTDRFDSRSAVNSSANATAHDGTEMFVSVHENGDARWNVTARFVLRDDNETAAFRQLAQDYENGTTNAGFTRETFVHALERASTDTDRPMELRDVERSGTLSENGSVGVLSLSFTWTNFTTVEENRILLGDVFWVGSETWLPGLTADQSLTVEGPPGYYVDNSGVPISGGTRIHFQGPRTFESDDFSVAYAPKRTVTTTATTTTTTTDGFPDLSGASGLLVVLLVFGIGFGAYAVSQRRGPGTEVAEPSGTDESPPNVAPVDDDDEGRPADRDDERGDDEDGPPPELMSDEERVLRLLRDNDGRMKQADIVRETNWSNAKVSQLLSKMNDHDDVDKLRIGRENLITLPDEDVTDLD